MSRKRETLTVNISPTERESLARIAKQTIGKRNVSELLRKLARGEMRIEGAVDAGVTYHYALSAARHELQTALDRLQQE